MTRDALGSLAIVAGALLTALAFAGILPEWGRAVIAVPFLLIGPGFALVRLLRIDDHLTEIVLAIAASLGLAVVVSTVLLALQRWTPEAALAILIATTLVAVILWGMSRPGQARSVPSPAVADEVSSARKGGQP